MSSRPNKKAQMNRPKVQRKQVQIPVELLMQGMPMVCSNCGAAKFGPLVKSYKLSKLHPDNPTGQDIVGSVPTGVFCITCSQDIIPIPKDEFKREKGIITDGQ